MIFFLLLSFLEQTNAQLTQEIYALAREKSKEMPNQFQFSIAILQEDSVKYFGFLKRADSLYQVDNKDSIFEIGSVTKVFTSGVFAQMLAQNKIRLTDDISKLIKIKLNEKASIPLLSLANHSSGLIRIPSNLMYSNPFDPTDPYANYTEKYLLDFLKNNMILNQPGKRYEYSNTGAGLLAYTLAKVEKSEIDSLFAKYIFSPFGMKQTSFEIPSTIVRGINGEGKQVSNWHFDVLKGAGGMTSTTSDLMKWISVLAKNEDSTFRKMLEPTFTISEKMQVGLGWHIMKPNTPEQFYWHNGATGGYSSSVAFRTTNQTAVVILTNISALSPKAQWIDPFCFDLLDLIQTKRM